MTTYESLIVERRGPVGWLVFDRPQAANAADAVMFRELEVAWGELDADPAVRVIVNTGEGSAFQTGLDVVQLSRDPDALREQSRRTRRSELKMTAWHNQVHKPVIAAVNGVVAGVSLDQVSESDIPIASDKAYFVDPHVSIGLVSSHEMVNMARRIPVAVCLRMALLGNQEKMSAQRAYEVGLVTEVVPHDQLMPRARELAEKLCQNAPLAVWGTKMGILRGLGLPIEQAEEIAAGYLEVVEQSDDHKEGPRAFVEKRKPVWTAR